MHLEAERNRSRKCCSSCLFGCIAFIGAIFVVVFVILFIILPVVFKYSVELQRNLVFPIEQYRDIGKDFNDVHEYEGVQNFYIRTSDNVTLGCWQILPSELLLPKQNSQSYNYPALLFHSNHTVLLYLHGNGGDRSKRFALYKILRNLFHIIACDYRGYGDSTSNVLIDENTIVSDTIDIYYWMRDRTSAPIMIWGHSLGTGVSTHVISNLKLVNESVDGVILEAPFSSVVDVVELHYIVKLYSWLPWMRSTILDPFVQNHFAFNSTKYIQNVDCPILILHARDDEIIPYQLATKLYQTAISNRNTSYQGNVTYHLFDEKGYGHMNLFKAPELPELVQDFRKECLTLRSIL